MTMQPETADGSTQPDAPAAPQWRPIGPHDRRVLGVLVEKAKTTPDAYPMSLNALTAGCNQKSNRDPQMQLPPEDVEEALERLRALGVVVELHGDGRVPRYKHRLYEWLGVDKVEIAVMAELLLRGAQTIGELRGRAARMEPIPDLTGLKPVLDALVAKKLLVYLTPPQRGAVVTHTLYPLEEMERIRREHGDVSPQSVLASGDPPGVSHEPRRALLAPGSGPAAAVEPTTAGADRTVDVLKAQVQELRGEVQQLRNALESSCGDLRRDVDDLRRQLGV